MTFPFSTLFRASAGFIFLSVSSSLAQDAPVPLEPSVTTATYSDWTLRCVRDKDGKASLAKS